MKTEYIRVGIIGARNWANTVHLPAFAAQPDVSVVGITDINPETSQPYRILLKFPVKLILTTCCMIQI